MRASFAKKIRFLAIVVVLLAGFLGVRLYDVQVAKGAEYRERSESQYFKESSARFDRGAILMRSKDDTLIAAATLASGYTVSVSPKHVVNPERAYEVLSPHLSLSRDEFMEHLSNKEDLHEELGRRLPISSGAAIREAEVMGVHLTREKWRYYPGGQSAAQTLGFVGYGGGDLLSGQYGLERFYEDVLRKDSRYLSSNFFADLFTGITTYTDTQTFRPGGDVVISIEPNVQLFIEDVLARYTDQWSPQEVGVIILEPESGEVLAMAALPTYDPNDIQGADARYFSNPLVERVYEFGSIMKPLTMAAGLDSGAVSRETTYTDRGTATYDGATISNFDGKARGTVPMQEILSQSLNTGVAFIVERMGTDSFRDYFTQFGLRSSTGIDLPNEAEPLTDNLDSPRTIEYVTASFGQGIAVSPIAMARALSVLANGGILATPHVGVALQYPGVPAKALGRGSDTRVLSSEAVEETTRMLVEVVDTALRDGTVMVPEMSVAAKTGTAQIARSDARGYYDDRYLHSFFGYFPAYDPQFLIFLYAVAPQGARYSSETWTNPFMETVRFLTTYYDVPPDRTPTTP